MPIEMTEKTGASRSDSSPVDAPPASKTVPGEPEARQSVSPPPDQRRSRRRRLLSGALVEYGPGGYSPGHTHAKSAFIYATVLEGTIRSKVNDGPVTTYKAGQSWSELPGDRHGVSANASETPPAKLLAVFVVETNEKELTIPFAN
jgi:quercetin dioxygenase-like cupin family protein